jgi:hypothetical protein
MTLDFEVKSDEVLKKDLKTVNENKSGNIAGK